MSEQDDKAIESVEWIQARAKAKPATGIILGSGLGALAEHVSPRTTLPYSKIPNFPISTVSGHAGNLVFGLFGVGFWYLLRAIFSKPPPCGDGSCRICSTASVS